MIRFLLLLSLLALLLPPAVQAQTSYYGIPDNNAASGGGNVIPFGNGSPGSFENHRYQSLALKKYLPSKPGLLRSIAFSPTGSGLLKYKAMVVQIGHNTSGSLGPTLKGSFSTPPVTVLNRADFSWQVTQDTWSPLPLTSPKPFLYNGKDNLVIEIVSLGSDLNSKPAFHRETESRYYARGFTMPTHVSLYGKGCVGSNNKEPVLAEYSFPLIGADHYQVGLADAAPSTGALFYLGTSKTAYGPLKLPFDLTFLGATGCFLHGSITLLFPVATGAAGTASVNAAIPEDPVLEGATFYGQWLIADPKANPAGLVSTKGLESMMTRVDKNPGSPSAAALRVQLGFI